MFFRRPESPPAHAASLGATEYFVAYDYEMQFLQRPDRCELRTRKWPIGLSLASGARHLGLTIGLLLVLIIAVPISAYYQLSTTGALLVGICLTIGFVISICRTAATQRKSALRRPVIATLTHGGDFSLRDGRTLRAVACSFERFPVSVRGKHGPVIIRIAAARVISAEGRQFVIASRYSPLAIRRWVRRVRPLIADADPALASHVGHPNPTG